MIFFVNRDKNSSESSSKDEGFADHKLSPGNFASHKVPTKKKQVLSLSKRTSSPIAYLSQQRKKDLNSKFGFSNTELRIYEQICAQLRKLSVLEKTEYLASLLKNSSI